MIQRYAATLRAVFAALLLFALSATSSRATPLITQYVGAGSSVSFLTLDFHDNTPNPSYAFGYRYDGAKTGGDLVDALIQGAGLNVGFGSFFQPNDFVISFGYQGHAQPGPGASPDFFWSYWLGTTGSDWTAAPVGLRDRVLTNNSWDGWSWTTYDPVTFDPISPPRTPQAPGSVPAVPEPGTLPLAGAAFAVLAAYGLPTRRRRDKQAA